jgi:hypothetical protein
MYVYQGLKALSPGFAFSLTLIYHDFDNSSSITFVIANNGMIARWPCPVEDTWRPLDG